MVLFVSVFDSGQTEQHVSRMDKLELFDLLLRERFEFCGRNVFIRYTLILISRAMNNDTIF